MSSQPTRPGRRPWQQRVYAVLFASDTPVGKAFDVVLLLLIAASTAGVMLESVEPIGAAHKQLFLWFEWTVTVLFAAEYILRVLCLRRPRGFVFSVLGVVDLLSFLPTLMVTFFSGRAYFVVIRAVRLLRVFRIFKLGRYLSEGNVIVEALIAGRRKILVFLFGVGTMVIVIGTLMYIIEGAENGFTSIPRGIYWAVVTLTTVGYGDIAPQTVVGQTLAASVMVLGYSIIAVPTGIVTVEISRAGASAPPRRTCAACALARHDVDASFCNRCGSRL